MRIPFPSIISHIKNCRQTQSTTKQLHAITTTTHLIKDSFYATNIVRLYALNDDIDSSRNLFDKTLHRTVFLWNAMIRAYAKAEMFKDSIFLYGNMLGSDVGPDGFTYACLVRACYERLDVIGLRVLHSGAVLAGLGFDSIVCSSLVSGYSKLGLLGEAWKVFCRVSEVNLVMWNAMIGGYCSCGDWRKGLELFSKMREFGEVPDGFTFVAVISGLVDSGLLEIGQGIHGLCLQSGFACHDHVVSALVSMYSRFRCVNSAYRLFSSISDPDMVTWSALISGFSQAGDYENMVHLFRNLRSDNIEIDPVLTASILAAAATSVNLQLGVQIHGLVIRTGLQSSFMVSSAIIDMYSKCGFLESSTRAFNDAPNKNVVSYNSVMSSLAIHGNDSRVFELFEEILEKGMKPDVCTFSALLSTCRHSGLISKGREIFKRMKGEFLIQPKTEHYVHFVKLLGMAGELKEAYELVSSMNQPVDSGVWGALLSCCDAYGNPELTETAAKNVFDNDPVKGAYRVMVSNMYARDGRWADVKKVRDYTTNTGVRKVAGLSWIGGPGN